MITLKQYDNLLKECKYAALNSKRGSCFLMTACLFDELKTVFDSLSDDGSTLYYFCGLRVEVIETNCPLFRWWIIERGGDLN